ncbi:hypothetical protein GUJ93_ZPchr0011g28417 [Zizania palustris]|uniref:Uncharacterized protein n=1 Tax=Zizania palustris TaxID=103762 RepID=A0A8J5WML5_ZIZPA|nr:hypothetical protein GUJ93_ZPchr0011g28417 [Zizania palustris]
MPNCQWNLWGNGDGDILISPHTLTATDEEASAGVEAGDNPSGHGTRVGPDNWNGRAQLRPALIVYCDLVGVVDNLEVYLEEYQVYHSVLRCCTPRKPDR